MNESGSPAHLKITNVFLSPNIETFIMNSPADDRELVIQDGIDELISKISGDNESPDFSPMLTALPEMPVFASRIVLNTVISTLPVIIVGRFAYNGEQPYEIEDSSCQILANIFIGTPIEADSMLENWYEERGIIARFL